MGHAPMDVYEQHVAGLEVVCWSDWEQAATRFVRGALCLPLRDRLAAAQPAMWDSGIDLLDSADPASQLWGVVCLLRVLATTPNTGCTIAQRMLDERAHDVHTILIDDKENLT